ncbi:MAG: nuclear transport factor 2 family protein, partial [Candidatus Aminicenantes bacterium]
MKMSKSVIPLVVTLCLAIFVGFGPRGAVGRVKTVAESPDEYAAVKRAIEQSIGWAIEKDFDAMFRLWADDLFHFWLFSQSTVVGLEDF